MRLPVPVLVALCAVAATPAVAQTSSSLARLDAQHIQSIDNFVSAEMARQKIPGLSVGVYSRGTILLAKGYGQANVELGLPVIGARTSTLQPSNPRKT